MSLYPPRTRFLTAGLVAAVLLASGTGSARAPGTGRAPVTIGPSSVFLINGDRVITPAPVAGARPQVTVPAAHPGSLFGALIVSCRQTRTAAEIPLVALPYLDRGLAPGLFDLAALSRAERRGRLPLRVTYRGPRPVLPGLIVTRAWPGAEEGYLTASSAARFGVALVRQFLADRARGSYGASGLFARRISVTLATTPAPIPARSLGDALTVTGTDLAGQPDTGDLAWVFNTDACARFFGPGINSAVFHNGRASFTVPAGHYLAMGTFLTRGVLRLTVLPQFTVAGGTTVHLAARAARSQVTVITPRRAIAQAVSFTVIRTGHAGPVESTLGVSAILSGSRPALWVSPVRRRPTAGTLQAFTSATLASPPGRTVPYVYNLAFAGPKGMIPGQRFLVAGRSLAAVTERYYQDRRTTGDYGMLGGLLPVLRNVGQIVTEHPLTLPGRQIQYVTAGRAAVWSLLYAGLTGATLAGGQVDAYRSFPPGSHTENWNAYPLHPASTTNLIGAADPSPQLPEASRAGNTLVLDVTPFGDSVPGHTGWGFSGSPGQVSGAYEIDQNGTKIASGPIPALQSPDFTTTTTTLSPQPSVIKFTLTAARPASAFPLSPASRDAWTWRSAARPAATVPPPWDCGVIVSHGRGLLDRHCAVQPLLTLRYKVGRLTLDGTAPPGRQVLIIRAGHLQLAAQPQVTAAHLAVSFDGGRTWRQAKVTPAGTGVFRAVFAAPPHTLITLRTRAADRSGGSLTETILNAYRTSA